VDESAASVRGDGGPGFLEVLDDGVLFNETKNPTLRLPRPRHTQRGRALSFNVTRQSRWKYFTL
jgi:hypothetical protein